jgi:hypothetical protein
VIAVGALELFDRVVGKDKDGQPVKFSVSKTFTKAFAQRHLGWTWRRMTGAAKKLPEDWVVQGEEMAFQVVGLCSMHSVPDCLVVNSDQTGVHLKPFSKRTNEIKGAKQVLSLGKEDKRQFTMLGSVAAGWGLASSSSCVPGKDGAGLTKECNYSDSHFRGVAPHPQCQPLVYPGDHEKLRSEGVAPILRGEVL